ncbi:MAG: hypothetical protein RLZZ338_4070 [Cyanobacteriota bacterium]|jgi:hypothetical protein
MDFLSVPPKSAIHDIATAKAIRTDFVGALSPEFIPQTNNLQKPAPPH